MNDTPITPERRTARFELLLRPSEKRAVGQLAMKMQISEGELARRALRQFLARAGG